MARIIDAVPISVLRLQGVARTLSGYSRDYMRTMHDEHTRLERLERASCTGDTMTAAVACHVLLCVCCSGVLLCVCCSGDLGHELESQQKTLARNKAATRYAKHALKHHSNV
jgi:hypothetical protein